MVFLGELRVEATLKNLRVISYFIRGIGQRLELTEDTLFDLDLAVEEASANIVSHAYPPGQTGEIRVHAEMADGAVRIALTDWGRPLDPRAVKPFDISAPIETRIEGGMGLYLIQCLMDDVVRTTASAPGSPNTLTLVKRIERLKPGARRASTVRELNAMLAVSRVMAASVGLDDLLEIIVNELVAAIDADRGTLYLIDEEQGELFSHVLLEDAGDLTEIRLKVGQGIAGYVAATGEVLNIRDAYADPRFMRAFDQMTGYRCRTMLVAPMRNPQQKIIGVVQLLNKKGGPFTDRDERLLTAMATQAGIGIENARLYAQEIQQRLINQELETARAIQKSFLPQAVPDHTGWDVAALWRPLSEVSGDFYEFYTLPDGRLAVAVGDVSGRGVPAALFMALSVTVLRFAMSLNLAPGELMDRANQAIISGQQSRMFATAFIGYLDLDLGVLQFASAGHHPPLLYRAATGCCETLVASGVAMGLFANADYAEAMTTLADGDVLVLYTSGIIEVINAREEEFGAERLEELVVRHASCQAAEIADLIIQAVDTFAQDRDAFDDETLVVIKRVRANDRRCS